MSRSHFLSGGIGKLLTGTALDRRLVEDQYRDLEHQTETATLGMWLFLSTEVMMFGSLFLGLGIYRYLYATAFEKASEQLNWQVATANTLVLLTSSLTMVLAVHYSRHGNRKLLVRYLIATAVLGGVFLALKAYEYYTDYQECLIPVWRFRSSEWITTHALSPDQVPHVKLFLLFYWIMTSLHALHMIIGILMVSLLAWLARRDLFSRQYNAPVEVVGLYWHFVDIVWIFLLPMLYLLGTHS